MRSFETASPTSLHLVHSSPGVRMTFTRDEEVFAQEEPADLVYQVVSGAVRTTCLMADGRRHVGGFYFPGDFFGVEFADMHAFAAEALCDSVILVIKRSVADRDIDLQRQLWRAASRELSRSQGHLLLLSRKTALERVSSFLIDMAERQGGSDRLFLPMGRQDMADYLGLTIETVSRMMTRLCADGLIEMTDPRHLRLPRRAALMEACEQAA
jgi:CRP/FNR family nitrogen fixation transcriptional regulator